MERLKRWIVYQLAKGLLPIITEQDLITFNKQGTVFIAREQISDQELRNLKAEAQMIKQTRVWQLINGYLNNFTGDLVFDKSQSMTDLVVGKTVLYTCDVQKKVIEKIINAK